ncbi:hypothetical protein [Streptomyces sp. NPDC047315]|uniref:hypothetical protein n=1 Tax=Streptomyces sp. NPDC047315 TaxID=3155142 RepID=UPI0033C2D8E1
MHALPRDRFAPDRLWAWGGDAYVPVGRAAAPDEWDELLYADPDAAAVTQVRRATSSLSCRAVVVDMLDSLLLEPGHRVLELSTGTGWNAALAAARAGAGDGDGDGRITSVEVDPRSPGPPAIGSRGTPPGFGSRPATGTWARPTTG